MAIRLLLTFRWLRLQLANIIYETPRSSLTCPSRTCDGEDHFTHETERSWPLHSTVPHWSERPRPSKSTSHEKMKAERAQRNWSWLESWKKEKKEKKNYARTWYQHECEPVVQMLNTASHVVAWGFMPLWKSEQIPTRQTMDNVLWSTRIPPSEIGLTHIPTNQRQSNNRYGLRMRVKVPHTIAWSRPLACVWREPLLNTTNGPPPIDHVGRQVIWQLTAAVKWWEITIGSRYLWEGGRLVLSDSWFLNPGLHYSW